ncbi:MAG: haloacid dehalogenase [Acidobacteria bacterium]|nr:MAG: haloacid dehalogenase [Acidobacteriota bacterium]
MQSKTQLVKRYLLASDFDQTLSFHDSGLVLSELVGIPGQVFEKKTAILSVQNLVQQGGELAYLLMHDPEYRSRVRKEHLAQAGKGIRLKKNIKQLCVLLENAIEGNQFDLHVISAAPQEVVESALENIVPADHIHGTQLVFDASGQVESIVRVNAGYGKVALVDDLQAELQIGPDRIIYVGDGSSDIHVMLHVNHRDGFTIAVSEARYISEIAKRTVLSDDALSVLVPILEEIVDWDSSRIRAFFETQGLLIQGWDKVRADWVTIGSSLSPSEAEPEKKLSNAASA